MLDDRTADLVATAMRCATVIIVALILAPVFLSIARMLISYPKATNQENKKDVLIE